MSDALSALTGAALFGLVLWKGETVAQWIVREWAYQGEKEKRMRLSRPMRRRG